MQLNSKDNFLFSLVGNSCNPTDDTIKTSTIIRYINELEKLRDALKTSEERFHLLFENTTLVVAIAYPTGHLINCNGAFQRMLGYTKKELIGKPFSEFTHSEDAKKESHLIKEVKAGTRNCYKIEKRYICKDGKMFWGQTISNHICKQDKIVFAITTIEDVSERKKAEEELRQANHRLDAHMKNVPEAVIEFDSQYRIIRWSEEAERIFGWSEDEILGKSITEMQWVYEDDIELVHQMMSGMFTGERPRNVICNRIYRKDRAVMNCEWYNSAIYDSDGKLVSILSFVLDVTTKKMMQDQIIENAENLERLVEEKTKQLKDSEKLITIGQTAGMVGHDIRNPLQSIEGAIYLAKDEVKSHQCDDSQKKNILELLNIMEYQANYIDHIISDLQDFSRTPTPQLTETDIQELITRSIRSLKTPENIEISKVFQEDLKIVKTDPVFLKRVTTNLLTNAIQAMPKGGKIIIRTFRKDGDTYITFEDTGMGIPEENKTKIFTPLFTTKAKGQGFGLAVCKKLLEAQNGEITFESKKGKGTTFTIKLPTIGT